MANDGVAGRAGAVKTCIDDANSLAVASFLKYLLVPGVMAGLSPVPVVAELMSALEE